MDFLTELNMKADMVFNELIAAKRAAKAEKGVKAAYQRGRAEELEKWWQSLENMIKAVADRKGAEIKKQGNREDGNAAEVFPEQIHF